ncbi:MAG TPA: UDP-N-acetylmuramate--L-alanine ligase [Chlamydiales bacterium]|nr:UDP-N-acetylmuramate--L-alanine ligase [Chlamydiales bacterium]
MNYHFIGIGGIGMSALAKILIEQGHVVQGTDLKNSKLVQALITRGAKVHLAHDSSFLEEGMQVIYSSAVKKENPEYAYAIQNNHSLKHRSDLLCELLKDSKSLLVAGTHGKTTTTALLSHVFKECGKNPTYACGGVLKNYQTNAEFGMSDYFVAEADESDGSFLKMNPSMAIITNVDEDHVDYWESFETLKKSFKLFANKSEKVYFCLDDPNLQMMDIEGISYGFSDKTDIQAFNICEKDNGMLFSIRLFDQIFHEIFIPLIGQYNVLNSLPVIAIAYGEKISMLQIQKALKTFSGVQKRMDLIAQCHQVDFIDDYAHHPKEIEVTVKALRKKVRERRIVALFEPHRYSRFDRFFDDYCKALQEADFVIATDVYNAGGESPGFKSLDDLVSCLKGKAKYYPKEEIENAFVEIEPYDVVISLGAGGSSSYLERLSNHFEKNFQKKNLLLLYGGQSPEHDISIKSCENIYQNLDSEIYEITCLKILKNGQFEIEDSKKLFEILENVDLCFPIFHGLKGEDGMVQGFLETLQIPYVGAHYASLALAMNKMQTKQICQAYGIAIAPFCFFDKNDWSEQSIESIEQKLQYPLFVKPNQLGSSIGISKVVNREELVEAVRYAFDFDNQILIEQEVVGREIEFGVIGAEYLQVSLPGEILKENGSFYDYQGKYGQHACKNIVPAPLEEEAFQQGRKIVETIYKVLNLSAFARVDLFYNEDKKLWVLNEVNAIPGFTATSMFQKMFEKNGYSFKSLLDEVIISSFCRMRKEVK